MGKSQFLRPLLSALIMAAILSSTAAYGGEYGWASISKSATCQGLECLADATDEFDMEYSETNRRILATAERYISYGALQANNVPCSRRGASYYNCQPGAEANPYTRSCTAATQCRTS